MARQKRTAPILLIHKGENLGGLLVLESPDDDPNNKTPFKERRYHVHCQRCDAKFFISRSTATNRKRMVDPQRCRHCCYEEDDPRLLPLSKRRLKKPPVFVEGWGEVHHLGPMGPRHG